MKRVIITILFLASLSPAPLLALPGEETHPGKSLVVGILHDPPYIIKEKSGAWSGLNVDLWGMIARELKIDYTFKEMTFSDLLEALEKNRIDLSIASFFLLAERLERIDYSVPIGSTRPALATLPGRMDHPWSEAVKVFLSWGTLKLIGILLLILCILGTCFWLVERKSNPDHFGEGFIKGVGAGIYWVGSTLASGVCIGIPLKSVTARILGLLWMLSCAVALTALVASLTTTLVEGQLESLVLKENSLRHMRVGGIEAGAESAILRNIGGKYSLYRSEQEALAALLNNEIDGFLYDEVTLHYYKDNDYKERISLEPTDLKRFAFAFALPKDSPWRTRINASLLRIIEKRDWALLLNRYGVGQNLEELPAPPRRRGR